MDPGRFDLCLYLIGHKGRTVPFSNKKGPVIDVSKNSLKKSVRAYPFLKEKAVCVYNISDTDAITKRARQTPADWADTDLPVLPWPGDQKPIRKPFLQAEFLYRANQRLVCHRTDKTAGADPRKYKEFRQYARYPAKLFPAFRKRASLCKERSLLP